MCFVRHIVQHFTRPSVNATETRAIKVSSEKFPIGVTDYESKPQHLLVLNVYSESLFLLYISLKLLAIDVHPKIKNAKPH